MFNFIKMLKFNRSKFKHDWIEVNVQYSDNRRQRICSITGREQIFVEGKWIYKNKV